MDAYEILRAKLNSKHLLLAETEINGRPIANYLLKEPLIYNKRKVAVLELPAPKAGSHYKEGYEHVEFVVDHKLEDFIDNHPHVEFDLGGFGKLINRDVRVSFGSISVKFHEFPLKDIIAIEQANHSERS
jgi:predicted metalloenzyme YecM